MSFENLALLSRRDRIRLAVLVVILMTVALWASILLGDGRLKMKDQAWVWGGNLGLLCEFTPSTRVGLTWASQVNLNVNAPAEFSGLAPAVSAALARVGLLDASIKLGIKVPQQAMAGLFTQIDDRWALLGSVGW